MPVSDVPDDVLSTISSYSGGENCVRVGWSRGGDRVTVRHSGQLDAPGVVFTAAEWTAFIQGVKDGEFDSPPLRDANG